MKHLFIVQVETILGIIISLLLSTAMTSAEILFSDNFDSDTVKTSKWYIPTWISPTDGTYVGQTQFRVSQNSTLPAVRDGAAIISVDSYNPTGSSFYGTDLISNQSFSVDNGIHVTARAKMNTTTPGIVGGIFLYSLNSNNQELHDEIDFELLTNRPDDAQTNIYSNEPLGKGAPEFVQYAPGTIDEYHIYEIKWQSDQVSWFIDGQLVRTETQKVPEGPMYLHLNAWVPDSGWEEAYSADLRYTTSEAENQSFEMLIDSVSVKTISPENETTQLLVSEIYVATFGRAPAYAGLTYWTNTVEAGDFTIEQVAQSFFDQPETKEKFPEGSSNSELITTIFYNVFSRAPAAPGLAYWVDALDSGEMRRDQAIMAIINGAKAATGDSEDAAMLAKKAEIGVYFANSEIGTSFTANDNFMDWATNIISFTASDDFNLEDAEEYISGLY